MRAEVTLRKRIENSDCYKFLVKCLSVKFFENKRLILSYNKDMLPDGLGAQFQRIITIKALSENLNCSFENTGIKDFDEAVFNQIDQNSKINIINSWYELINVSGDKPKRAITINFNPTSYLHLLLLRTITRFMPFKIRLRIALPNIIVDKYPEVYNFCKNYLKLEKIQHTKPIRVVVHIRRGEVLLSQFRDRYLPFEHYEKILQNLTNYFETFKIEYSLSILMESISNPILDRQNEKVVRSLELDPNNPYLVKLSNGSFLLKDELIQESRFPLLSRGELVRNNNPLHDFGLMCVADVLIISKSSFSFSAGLLNGMALKIFEPFWHTPPNSWISANDFLGDTSLIIQKWYAGLP